MANSSGGIFQSQSGTWSSGMMADWVSGLTYSRRDCLSAAASYWFAADCVPRALFHLGIVIGSGVFGGSHKRPYEAWCTDKCWVNVSKEREPPDIPAVHQARWHKLSLEEHWASCKNVDLCCCNWSRAAVAATRSFAFTRGDKTRSLESTGNMFYMPIHGQMAPRGVYAL